MAILHTNMYICEKATAMSSILQDFLQNLSNGTDVKKHLTKKMFLAKDLPVSYRQINHWNEKGLLIEKTEMGKWREFSFMEYVWVLMIVKLREWGVGLSQIKSIRDFMASSIGHLLFSLLEEEKEIIDQQGTKPTEGFKELWEIYQESPASLLILFPGKEHYHLTFFISLIIEGGQDILLKMNPDKETPVYFVPLGNKDVDLQTLMDSFFNDGGGILISLRAIIHKMYDQSLFDWKKVIPKSDSKMVNQILRIMNHPKVTNVAIEWKNNQPDLIRARGKTWVVSGEEIPLIMLKKVDWDDYEVKFRDNQAIITPSLIEKIQPEE